MLRVAVRHDVPGFRLDAAFGAPSSGITAIFGASGSGKSSLLKAVAGLLRADALEVTLNGTALHGLPPERRGCGVVFQEARLFPHMTVRRNLDYGARRAPAGGGPDFAEVVALLGLEALLARRPAGLSGGERQRVALGRALLARPRLLLLDEPLASLDAPRRAEIIPFLARLRDAARLPMLYVTHALDEVDALADHLVLLDHGRVLAEGTPDALSLRPDLPLAARRDAGALLSAVVLEHDPPRGLSRLRIGQADWWVRLRPEPPGASLRLRLRARDVSLAHAAPQGMALVNALPATITAARPGQADDLLLTLDVAGAAVLGRIPRAAAAGFAPGQALVAMISPLAFDHSGAG